MITGKDLATLAIRRVIFHDVPRNPRGGAAQPTLAEDQTQVDAAHKAHLKTKLTRVLASKSAYPIRFDPSSASPVPERVRYFTRQHRRPEQFVEMSQTLANYLFEQQHGGISSGLLCAVDVAASGLAGLVLMKLEREEGARLELTETPAGKKTFAMSVLDNLVLTEGTRLFKTAMFLRTGSDDDSFRATACDSQLHVTASDDIARFWLRFLGCTFAVQPRVATQRFFDSTLRFINEAITDPVHKNDLYEHLQSQIKAETRTFSPEAFIEGYVREDYREAFRESLTSDGVPLATFTKDLSDIKSRLRHLAYITTRGARVSVPAENAEIVDVNVNQIIVNDVLLSVDHK
jgi:hypothetical protein